MNLGYLAENHRKKVAPVFVAGAFPRFIMNRTIKNTNRLIRIRPFLQAYL